MRAFGEDRSTDTLGLALVLLAVLTFGICEQASAANIFTGPVDKAGFQALVDAADPGDTIRCLGGVYDFSDHDAVLIDKALAIVAADTGDPPLFVGDTIEGGPDDPPVLNTPSIAGNTAFALTLDAEIHGLELRGLHFAGFERTLPLSTGTDYELPDCPRLDAEFTGLEVVGNYIRNTRRAFQIFGGPLDGFVIKDNLLRGDTVGAIVLGVENVTVKANEVEAGVVGILVGDDKASVFPDDGPISIGTVKGNTIRNAFLGINAIGPTTITDAVIEGNYV